MGSVSTQGFRRVRNSKLCRPRVFSRIVFLKRVSESFGWFSRLISSGYVRFHFLLLEVCVVRVCVCEFCANAILRENFRVCYHLSLVGHRLCSLGRLVQDMLRALVILVCSRNRIVPKCVFGFGRLHPLCRKCGCPCCSFRLISGVEQDEDVLFVRHCVLSVVFV